MIDRDTLDAFAARYKLSHEAVEATFEIARARPSKQETLAFLASLLRIAGLLAISVSVVFFIAANWQGLQVFGRFALIELLLVAAMVVAWWRPPPLHVGRGALFFAFVMTGVLLALVGQTYQTGADVYELFLMWAVLGTPLVFAAHWSVTWAAWLLVLNLALGLFCAMQPANGLFWMLLPGGSIHSASLLLVPMMVDLALWALCESLAETRWASIVPRWLARLVLALALAYATWAGVLAIIAEKAAERAFVLVFVLIALAGIARYAIRRRADVFPLAAIAASLVVLTSYALAEVVHGSGTKTFFVLSVWLVVSSAVSGRLLMKWVRAWGEEEQE
jgi:uncharacterized membrane protein